MKYHSAMSSGHHEQWGGDADEVRANPEKDVVPLYSN